MMSPFSTLRSMSPFMSASPFGMVRRMFDDMERMMDSMLPDYDELGPERVGMGLDFMPQIDVSRRGDMIVVHADLPGLSAEDLAVHTTDEGLVIEGERRRVDERTEGDIWRSERSYGRFSRLILLPEGVDPESAQARFENGVLEIQVKAPEGRGRRRQIEIQGHGQGQGEQAQRPVSQPSSSDQAQTARTQGKS
jgi:HSP20 family protein